MADDGERRIFKETKKRCEKSLGTDDLTHPCVAGDWKEAGEEPQEGQEAAVRRDEAEAGAEPMDLSEEKAGGGLEAEEEAAEGAPSGEKDPLLEEDAQEGESEGSGEVLGEEEEEEEEPGLNEYEADGFLVLDDEPGVELEKKTRRHEDRFIPLEEDDLELIGSERRKKKTKRLKRKGAVVESDEERPEATRLPFQDEEPVEEEEAAASQAAESQGAEPRGGSRRRGGGGAGAAGAAAAGTEGSQRRQRVAEEEDDFIVGGKRSRAGAHADFGSSNQAHVTDQQLAEWQAIFGDDKGIDAFVPDTDYVPEGEDAVLYEQQQRQQQLASQAAMQRRTETGQPTLASLFEPAALEKQFLTKRDLEIKSEDIPERLQVRIPNRPEPEEGELDLEANWCLRKYCKKNPSLTDAEQNETLRKIFYVLHFVRTTNLEVPFLYQYRIDDLYPLSEEDCWDVYDWDEEWHRLNLRKRQLLTLYGNVQEMVRLGAEERFVQLISAAETDDDLNDLTDYFQFNFPQKRAAAEAPSMKRPVGRNLLSDAKQQGYAELASQFAITASQLGDNMYNNQMIHTPADIDVTPEEFVAPFVKAELGQTPEALLSMCRELLAHLVANDPYVRESIRAAYLENGSISTHPTERGVEEIAYWHEYRDVKRLEGVPFKDFQTSELFVRILRAEKEGFVTVSIDVEDSLESALELYLSKSYDSIAVQWNKQRRLILAEAFQRYIHPLLKAECRKRLEEDGLRRVAQNAAKSLNDLVGRAPYIPPPTVMTEEMRSERGFDTYRGPQGHHVLSICVPPDESESPYAVVVDRFGQVVEWAKVSFMDGRRPPPPRPGEVEKPETRRQALVAEDHKKLQTLVLSWRPRTIIVGASTGAFGSRNVMDALQRTDGDWGVALKPIMHELENSLPFVVPKVLWLDGRVSRVFANTNLARAEMKDFAPALRQAVSLARASQDPLMETARLWEGPDYPLTFVTFHPLQDLVPKNVLHEELERVLIRVTNKVGVDINNAAKHPHLASTLQFVAGLGPRKAKGLLTAIQQSGATVCGRMTDLRRLLQSGGDESQIVWTNAAAFIRITAIHFAEHDKKRGPLDDTRIHPSDYRFAIKVALDALDRTEDVRNGDEEEIEQMRNDVLREVMGGNSIGAPNDHFDDIVRVDVTGMAEAWRENYGENKARVMQAMKEEMLHPYAEKRGEFVPVERRDAFWLTVDDTLDLLAQGKLVRCFVRNVSKNVVRVELEYDNIPGVITRDMLSDKQIESAEEVVAAGTAMNARILDINYERWEVNLVSKSSELNNYDRYENPRHLEETNPHLRWIQAEHDRLALMQEKARRELERQQRQQRQGQAAMRVVDHPAFRNFTVDDVIKALQDAPCGEAIFRPSSKGKDFLTLSFKGLREEIVHVMVAEKDKPHEHALGRKLSIKGINEEYEDLDEVIARYVNPVASLMAQLSEHRRFCDLPATQIEEQLRRDKAANPQQIAYRIGFDEKNPGFFKIFFLPNTTIVFEAVSVRPSGFRLKSRMFLTVNEMLEWWKRHWQDKDASSGSARSRKPGSSTADKRRR